MKIPFQVAAAVVTLFAASAAHAQQAVQWKMSDGGTGHWYQLVVDAAGLTWPTARQRAQDIGGDLAVCSRPGSTEFVQALLLNAMCGGSTGQAGPYVGGFQDLAAPDYSEPAGGWRWVDGSPFPGSAVISLDDNLGHQDYLHFISLQPSCGGPFVLDDVGLVSNANRSFVVEWSADCNGDGVVDYGQILDGTLADTNTNGIPDICETRQVAPYYRTLSIADQANIRAQNWNCPGFSNGGLYPLGSAIYAGTPFEHGPAGQYAFMGGNYCGDSPRSLAVNVSAPGTATIRILLNSWNGCNSGPDFLATVTFADGTSRSWTLVNGIDYRDHNGTCPLLGNRSQEVWSSGQNQRIDMLTLPIERPGATTTGVRIESTDPASQIAAPFVFGITVSDSADCNGDGIADWGQCLNGTLPDRNGNGIPDICEGPTCRDADLFRDGQINGADLGILLFQWGPANAGTVSDINHDGVVNGADLGFLLANWGPCPG